MHFAKAELLLKLYFRSVNSTWSTCIAPLATQQLDQLGSALVN